MVSQALVTRKKEFDDEGWAAIKAAMLEIKDGNGDAAVALLENIMNQDLSFEGVFLGLSLANRIAGHHPVAKIYGGQASQLNSYLAPKPRPDLYDSYLALLEAA